MTLPDGITKCCHSCQKSIMNNDYTELCRDVDVCTSNSYWVLADKYKPKECTEMQKRKFEVGDKVVSQLSSNHALLGKVGVVKGYDKYGYIIVEYDEPTGADHDGDGLGRPNYCWRSRDIFFDLYEKRYNPDIVEIEYEIPVTQPIRKATIKLQSGNSLKIDVDGKARKVKANCTEISFDEAKIIADILCRIIESQS